MAIGKLKMKLALFIKKEFSFYEYARHTLVSSSQFVLSTMADFNKNQNINHIIYFQTKNFYLQLLAAYSASQLYYPIVSMLVPLNQLDESIGEMLKGNDVGIKAWTFDNDPINDELVGTYRVCFNHYYNGLIKDNNSSIHLDPNVFNPDIDSFSKSFIEDSIFLMLRDNNISINEVEQIYLKNIIAGIPLSMFTYLSNKSLQFIPDNN